MAAVVPRMLGTRRDPAALASLGLPLLFIVGERDPLFPPAVVRAAADELPGAQLAEIPGTGHSPYFEDPDAWNAVLREFLTHRRQSREGPEPQPG